MDYLALLAAGLALIPACTACAANEKTVSPYTSFQTPSGYRADNDIRTDAVIVYADRADWTRSWQENGYVVQTMYGFRTGQDYADKYPGEIMTAADGTMLTCGPGSYYTLPTENRIKAAVDYFRRAIEAGSSAVIPEEPEAFASAGYEAYFKQEWERYYHEPWQDPGSSIEARYKADRLKAQMEYNMIKSIMDAAEAQNPAVRRMVACHSAPSYYSWGIIYPHYQCLMLPNLQEIIGQVWTGTARTPCRYAGKKDERTFEFGFLEYSHLYNLTRGTGKRMWFLMDPLEDNPDRSMEDYHANYERTLVASLMFPEVDAYEVMPWPTRIYGRVPDEFATEISSIIAALQDMHNQKTAHHEMGTQGIATLVADSMGWQRGEPHPSNFDCFYGMTLPLVYKGIPIQVAQLERAPEKGYLDQYKVILLSYDIMKPMKPEYNQAIADWVKRGGTLVFFGGTDAYNALPEWWKKRGFESPQADLYARLGVKGKLTSVEPVKSDCTELARADGRYRSGENRKVYRFDLKPFTRNGTVFVRFSDAFPGDGWGPAVFSVKLTSGGKIVTWFEAGAPDDRKRIAEDFGSILNSAARFADGDAYWVYRFDVPKGSSPVLEVDMQNQFVVEASDSLSSTSRKLVLKGIFGTEKDSEMSVPATFPLTSLRADRGVICALPKGQGPIVSSHEFGKGNLIHVGVAPSYFASSPAAADQLRGLTYLACKTAGIVYNEMDWMGVRRGKYRAVRTFDGMATLTGAFVNILDPKLGVVRDPEVGPGKCALYCDVTAQMKARSPSLLYASCKVEAKSWTPGSIRLKPSGPAKTKGVVRVCSGGKSPEVVSQADVKVETDKDTILLTFDNKTEGVDISLVWK